MGSFGLAAYSPVKSLERTATKLTHLSRRSAKAGPAAALTHTHKGSQGSKGCKHATVFLWARAGDHIGTHHALCICTVLLSSPWKATFHRASTALSFQLALHVLQVVAESLLLGLWKATFHGASTALSFLVAACTSGRRRSSAFGTL